MIGEKLEKMEKSNTLKYDYRLTDSYFNDLPMEVI